MLNGKYNNIDNTKPELSLGRRQYIARRFFNWENPNVMYHTPVGKSKLTKEGLKEFLNKPNVIIYSEYFNSDNRIMEYTDDPDKANSKEYLWTPQQFLDMAFNWGQPDGWDGESYEKWEMSRGKGYQGYTHYGDSKEGYWREKGYNPSYYNFYNDSLRWSTCCEFS